MPPANPYLVALYVALFFVTIPAFKALWWVATFFAKAVTKLDKIDKIDADVTHMKDEKNRESNSLEMSLSIIEGDINVLQMKAGIDKRQFPDRRIGPADRRTA